jgi:uncharacterized protein (DUF924 family)
METGPQTILHFWFHESKPEQWWRVEPAFDQLIATRFALVHRQATQGELFGWRADISGRLAEIIVLDQFSRNMFRGHRRAFEADAVALVLAQEAVATGADMSLSEEQRVFLYMPYMHSESRAIHKAAEQLFLKRAPKDNYEFELRHKAIIDRFGRYPHRNLALGRDSTPEELAFLKEPGSRF